MHSILNFEHVILDSTLQESFEHAAAVACLVPVRREHSGRKLLLVTHQNNLLRVMLKRDQVCQLYRLASFVDDEVLKTVLGEVVEHF